MKNSANQGGCYPQRNMMMQRTANENAACERRICKRSDQPKILFVTFYFWLIRSFTDLAFTGSIFVCGPLHHHISLSSNFGGRRSFQIRYAAPFNMAWP